MVVECLVAGIGVSLYWVICRYQVVVSYTYICMSDYSVCRSIGVYGSDRRRASCAVDASADDGIDVVPVADDMPKDSRMPYSIAAEEVADTSISGRNIVVHMHDRSFMLIPLDAADDRMALIDAVDSLVKTQE